MQKGLAIGLFLALAGVSFGQKETLTAYVLARVTQLAPNAPLVYLEGDRLRSDLGTLEGFDRKVLTVGALKAIVPVSMVQIDDPFGQEPDLYEGMDNWTKIRYFLSLLNEEQIKTASSKGIGIGDVNREQAKVLNSIIPKIFRVERKEADGLVVDKFDLTDQQRLRVRLKFTRSLELEMPLADGSSSYIIGTSVDYRTTERTAGYFRRKVEKVGGSDECFGIKVRSIVPNEPKESNLDYKLPSLKKLIKLTGPTPIIEVCNLVRKSTNISVIPDLRVARLDLTLIGSKVRAGDLLKAIAAMVTGTYRRVGSEYVLTSEITGLGTRRLRLSQWEEDIRFSIQKNLMVWGEKIGNSALLNLVKSNPNDPTQSNDKLKDYLAKNDSASPGNRTPVPDDAIDATIRDFIRQHNETYRSQPVTEKGLVVNSELRFNFTLPSGQDVIDLEGQSTLGTFSGFRYKYSTQSGELPPLFKKVTPESNVGLVIRLSNFALVETQMKKAKEIGFKEIWLETSDKKVLVGAVDLGKSLGLNVRFVIRPWLSTNPSDNRDLTLLGHTADSLNEWMRRNERLSPSNTGTDFYRTFVLSENTVSPDSNPESWNAFRELSQTPGLSGVVVLDPEPSGYEQMTNQSRSIPTSSLLPRRFGYSLSMRSQFLREFGVDPIDLVSNESRSQTNLSPFFFLDEGLKGAGHDYNSYPAEAEQVIAPFLEQWNKFRISKMAEGSKRFFNSILDKITVPIWSDLVLNSAFRAVSETIPQTKFVSADGYVLDPGNAGVPFGVMVRDPASMRVVIDPIPSLHTDVMVRSYSQILKPGQKFPFTFCYDLSRLKPDEVTKFLDKWFDPQKT